jgi:hypothetical protein
MSISANIGAQDSELIARSAAARASASERHHDIDPSLALAVLDKRARHEPRLLGDPRGHRVDRAEQRLPRGAGPQVEHHELEHLPALRRHRDLIS